MSEEGKLSCDQPLRKVQIKLEEPKWISAGNHTVFNGGLLGSHFEQNKQNFYFY